MSTAGSNPLGNADSTGRLGKGDMGSLGVGHKSGKHGGSAMGMIVEHLLDKESRRRDNIDWQWRAEQQHKFNTTQFAQQIEGQQKLIKTQGKQERKGTRLQGAVDIAKSGAQADADVKRTRATGAQERAAERNKGKVARENAAHAVGLATQIAPQAAKGSAVQVKAGEHAVTFTTPKPERQAAAKPAASKAPASKAPAAKAPATKAAPKAKPPVK